MFSEIYASEFHFASYFFLLISLGRIENFHKIASFFHFNSLLFLSL